jgi:hypothetical protein
VNNRILALLLGVLPGFALPVCAAEDYLSILEAEADDTGGRTDAANIAPAARPAREVRSVKDNRTIRPALGFEEFEAELNAHYSGSWFLYDKLTSDQRMAVYSAYQEDNRTSKVREKIVELLSAQ